jgi:hypothetical protein
MYILKICRRGRVLIMSGCWSICRVMPLVPCHPAAHHANRLIWKGEYDIIDIRDRLLYELLDFRCGPAELKMLL